MKALDGTELTKVLWKDIRDGDIVYLYATHQGKEYGIGPFRVVSKNRRALCRVDSKRNFLNYPEELYRIKI